MSNFNAFLKPVYFEKTKEFVLSDRFLDEEGKPAKMTIRSITQEKNNDLVKLSTKRETRKGIEIEELDRHEFQARLITTCVVEPDFSGEEICKTYGVVDPLQVPTKMLFPGEYARLLREIMANNGFKDDTEVGEEAKNS